MCSTGRGSSFPNFHVPYTTRWWSNRRICENVCRSACRSTFPQGGRRSLSQSSRRRRAQVRTSSSSATSSSTRCRSRSWTIAARCALVSRTDASESFVPASAAEIEFLDRYSVHPEEGERVEAPLASLVWMDRIAEVFRPCGTTDLSTRTDVLGRDDSERKRMARRDRRGFAVLIDYGYTREEQLAGRHRDTIMAYRQHTASGSPYEAPGEQDITAHVNFTALRARGVERGLEALALLTQSQFLLGIAEETQSADAFQDCKLPQERAKVALQLKHLVAPSGMGETFQVLVMSCRVATEKAARLSGLRLAH